MKIDLPCIRLLRKQLCLKSMTMLFLFTITCLAFSKNAFAGTITTDKGDYLPGETVRISGTGWASGEAVTLQVLHVGDGDNSTSGAHAPWTVNADATGKVTATWVVPPDQDEFGATLQLTATANSGSTSTTFTDGGAPPYNLTLLAADPEPNRAPYLPTYQKLAPSLLACTASGGRASNPLPNAQAYAPPANPSDLDAVTSLAPKDMALCQVVPYFMEITVTGPTTAENGTITFTNDWLAKTTSGADFGFDPAIGLYCAFVDVAEPGTIDAGNNAKVDSYSSNTLDVGGSNERIEGNIQVSGLDEGDHIIVELWVALKCSIPAGSTGNVQANIVSAQTATGDAIGVGNQTVPLLKVQEFFSSKADIQVTKTSDPVCLGKDITYNIAVKNNATSVVANGVVATDVLGAGQTFVSASGAPYTYDANTRTVTFNVGAVTQLQTINLTVVATANTTPSVDNSVSVTEITTDDNLENNTSSITTTVNPLPECDITGGIETINAGGSTHWCATDNMKSYSWTGPNGFTATTQCVDVSDEGDYYVTIENNNGCTSTCQRHLTVLQCTTPPNAGTNGTLTLCEGSLVTLAQLFAALGGTPDQNGTWSDPVGGVYTYTVLATGACTQNATSTVTVTFQSKPNAGTSGTLNVCEGTTITEAMLFGAITGEDAGGTWSGPVNGVYTYTVHATAPCTEDATSTVTVTEQAKPNAGTSGTLNVCAGTTITEAMLYGAITGEDAGGTWSGPVGNVYTYTVHATAPCTEDATSTVTVTTQSRPNAGTSGTLTVCAGTTITEAMLYGAITGEDAGGTWSGPVGNVYTYTVHATAPCTEDATSTVTVTFNPVPSCTITNVTSAGSHIAGLGQSVQFSGPSGTNYAYYWSISGNTAGATFSGATNVKTVTVNTTTAGSYTLVLKVTDKTYPTNCNSTCTYQMNIAGAYYTVTQGFYGNVGGKICTPSGGLFTAGAKGNEAGLIALSINNMIATGQKLKLGITPVTVTATSRTFIMGSSTTEVNNLIKYLPATQTATVITANTGTNHNTDMISNWPKLYNKKISDILLGQTITLALNVNIPQNTLGGFVLQTGYLTTQKADLTTCPVKKIVQCSTDATAIGSMQITTNTGLKNWINAAPAKTVMDLLSLASNALGGANIATLTGQTGITLSDINNAVDVINRSFDGGRFFLGYYATQQSCTTQSAAIARVNTNISNQLIVKAYPNPYLNAVNFNFTSPVSGKAVLEAYDLLGKKLAIIYSGNIQANVVQNITYNVPADKRVQMIYRLTVGDKSYTAMIIPQK